MAQRLVTYRRRQPESRWGRDYQPAIRATPQEAPRISRPTILKPELLGRDMHLLSTPEADAALLALHNPRVFDIHEQKVLSTIPTTHPLFGHPSAGGLQLSPLEGTVRVAHRLGILSNHPKVFLPESRGPDGSWIPFPFVGDLLLYLRDDEGPYCVNWTIKLTEEDFCRRGPRPLGRARTRSPDPQAELRHKLEEQYYADAGIRTIRVTGKLLDFHLIANLRDIFGWHGRDIDVDTLVQSIVCDWYRNRIDGCITGYDLTQQAAKHFKITQYAAKTILYRSVWKRDILVDLFKPFLIDRPVQPIARDPLVTYSTWFER